MTEQHPLTDEICDSLIKTPWVYPFTDFVIEDMRTAADWQLEMVFRFMKTRKNESDPESSEFYDLLIQDMMDEMRPQQQEEEQKGLTGPELLAKVKEMGESSDPRDVLIACGYVDDGTEYLNFDHLDAFYKALIEAHGVDMKRPK